MNNDILLKYYEKYFNLKKKNKEVFIKLPTG